ncbi:Os02g0591500, partial [Oryza sativa Japonica Group]
QYAYNFTYHLQAVERKSRLGNAAVRQQIQLSEDSSRSVDPATPVQKEEGVPQSTPTPPTQKALDAAAPCPGSTQAVASTSTAYLAEGKPKASSSSPSDCSFQTPSRPNDPALADLMEKELSSSIEQIEKMVRKNLKRAPKAAQPSKVTIQKRTLLSMR